MLLSSKISRHNFSENRVSISSNKSVKKSLTKISQILIIKVPFHLNPKHNTHIIYPLPPQIQILTNTYKSPVMGIQDNLQVACDLPDNYPRTGMIALGSEVIYCGYIILHV